MTLEEPSTEPQRSGQLVLRLRGGRHKHYLLGRTVNGGDVLQLCFSGGWVSGRYEWAGDEAVPRFHFSIELGGGRVWESSLELPEGALLRWPDS
jgi:hypothetical protein